MNTQNYFAQIQKVLNVITKDKDMSGKFSGLASIEEKFNFTLEVCKKLSIEASYTLEEFNEFYSITSILHEISNDEVLSKDLEKAEDLKEVLNLMNKMIAKKQMNIAITEKQIEKFMSSLSDGKTAIPPESLKSVSGGNIFKIANDYFDIGKDTGHTLKKIFGRK